MDKEIKKVRHKLFYEGFLCQYSSLICMMLFVTFHNVSENFCDRIKSFGLSVANQPSVKRKGYEECPFFHLPIKPRAHCQTEDSLHS